MTTISSGVRPASAIGQNNLQSNAGKVGLKSQALNGFILPAKQDVFFSGLGSMNKDIDKLDKDGFNALHRAVIRHGITLSALFKKTPIAEVIELLDKGASPNTLCATGEPPIVLLARDALKEEWRGSDVISDNQFTLKYLLKAGAEVDKPDKLGRTAFSYAAAKKGGSYFTNILLNAGPDVNKQDYFGRTPLSYAAESSVGSVQWLIENGADVNIPDYRGRTPISYAAEHGKDKAITPLVLAGADFEKADNEKKTPLQYAEASDKVSANVFAKKALLNATIKAKKEKENSQDPFAKKALLNATIKAKKEKENSQDPLSDDSDNELARWNAEFRMPGGFGGLIAGSDFSKKKSDDEQDSLPRSSSVSRRDGKKPVTELDGRSIHELDARRDTPTPKELDGNQIHELLVEHPELDGNEIYELPTEREGESSRSKHGFLSRFKK